MNRTDSLHQGSEALSLRHARCWRVGLGALEVESPPAFSMHHSKLLEVSYGSNQPPPCGKIHRGRERRHHQCCPGRADNPIANAQVTFDLKVAKYDSRLISLAGTPLFRFPSG